MKLSFERKERKEIFDLFPIFLGEGCFKRVYTNEEGTLVLKVPKEEEGDYEEVEEYEVDHGFSGDSYNGYFDCDPEFIFEAPFPELILKTSRFDNNWKNFVANRENRVDFYDFTYNMNSFVYEIENYINASPLARKALNPIVEVGFFHNNCPYIIAERVDEVFNISEQASFSNKKRVSCLVYNDEDGNYSIKNFMKLKEDPISVMGEFLKFTKKEIILTKYYFYTAINELGLSFCEQVDNWGNLGCDTKKRKIYMIDYA